MKHAGNLGRGWRSFNPGQGPGGTLWLHISLQQHEVRGIKKRLMFDDFAVLEPPADGDIQLYQFGRDGPSFGVIAKADVEIAPTHAPSRAPFLRSHILERV